MQRIYGFTWLNCQGEKVEMFENDFPNRKAFMNVRSRLKRIGISVIDMKTSKPYNNPNEKNKRKHTSTHHSCSEAKLHFMFPLH